MKTNHAVKNMTVHLDKPTLEIMKLYPEVNWSNLARTSIIEYVNKRQLGDKLIMKRNYLKQGSITKNPDDKIEQQSENTE